jgi:hypothetical protein
MDKHSPPKFRNGDRVILRSYPVGHEEFPEGLPEEHGVVDWDDELDDVPLDPSWPIMYVVYVDPPTCGNCGRRHFEDPDDDGIREVSEDQMEHETPRPVN